jgi:hypothetical protein
MPAVTQVRIENVTPTRLVELVHSGRIRLPSFQRDYRWRPGDVESLFDSVLRRYPIGNLLLWERPAPAERVTLGPLVLDVPESQRALWVVDGQQRITSLVGALTAPEGVSDPRFGVYVHLPTLRFRAVGRAPEGPWLPIRVAGSNQLVLAWQRANAELLGDPEYAAADEVTSALRRYPIPSYVVEVDDERQLRVVFDRMNNYGRALRKEEVFDALHGVQDIASPGDLGAVGDAVATAGFGRIHEREILRSLLALRGADVFRDIHDEFTDDDDRREAFLLTERVLLDVVAVLRDDLGIPHVRLLPYPSVIPMLAALVHRFGRPTHRAVTLLRRWLWRGAALGANPGGNVPLVRRTVRAVRGAATPGDAALVLLDALPTAPGRWVPDLAQVALGRALARVNVLGLVDLGPRELVPAQAELPLPNPALAPGELLDTVEHPLVRIVPAHVVDPLTTSLANRVLHRPIRGGAAAALVAADVATRASHGVDETAELLLARRWKDFLEWRADLLTEAIGDVVDRHAEWGARDRFSAAELLRAGQLGA